MENVVAVTSVGTSNVALVRVGMVSSMLSAQPASARDFLKELLAPYSALVLVFRMMLVCRPGSR